MTDKRFAVFSDVHSNYLALQAVLGHLCAEDAARPFDGIWCLGDLIGRGPEPINVLETLLPIYEKQSDVNKRGWLKGNHDMLVLDELSHDVMKMSETSLGDEFNASGHTLPVIIMAEHNQRLHKNYESGEQLLEWLRTLNTHAVLPHNVFMAHGAFRFNPNGTMSAQAYRDTYMSYTKKPPHVITQFEALRENSAVRPSHPNVLLNGHTHYCMLSVYHSDTKTLEEYPDRLAKAHRFENPAQNPVFVNPGSVGFPRPLYNGDPRYPTYAVLTLHGVQGDTVEAVTVEFHVIEYDPSPYLRQSIINGPGKLATQEIPPVIFEEVSKHGKEEVE